MVREPIIAGPGRGRFQANQTSFVGFSLVLYLSNYLSWLLLIAIFLFSMTQTGLVRTQDMILDGVAPLIANPS